MGSTFKKLSSEPISNRSIFSNRLVVEICEKVHLHYRNLRINLSMGDFVEFAKGMIASYERWKQRGCPEPKLGQHIELCRKKVGSETHNDGIQVNLNHNLYKANKGKIFSEGAQLNDNHYIHIKVRDIRIELTLAEYKVFSHAIKEADKVLERAYPLLQEAGIHG